MLPKEMPGKSFCKKTFDRMNVPVMLRNLSFRGKNSPVIRQKRNWQVTASSLPKDCCFGFLLRHPILLPFLLLP